MFSLMVLWFHGNVTEKRFAYLLNFFWDKQPFNCLKKKKIKKMFLRPEQAG